MMTGQDWDVQVLRGGGGGGRGASRDQGSVNRAFQTGAAVETASKYGAGGNRTGGTDLNTRRSDEDTENLKHKTVSADTKTAIIKGRNAKGMSQKDLATKINEQVKVVQEYESGKAIPSQQVLNKLERALGIKLRGKDIGTPLASGKPKK